MFFLQNRMPPGIDAPIVLVEEGTGRVVRPEGADWTLEIWAGPKDGDLQLLKLRQPWQTFRSGPGAGYFSGMLVQVPNVPPGTEARVELYLAPANIPEVRFKLGSYVVPLGAGPGRPEFLPMGTEPLTNALPAGLLERMREKPPAIPGEPSHEGLPLSYWLLGFEMKTQVGPMQHSMLRPSFDQSRAVLQTLGLSAVPYVLQRPSTNSPDATLVIMQALGAIGHADEVDEIVWNSLSSTNPLVRINAVRGLPCATLKGRFDALRQKSAQEDPEFHRLLLTRFGGCEVRNAQLLPDWVALLSSTNRIDRGEALRGLKALGPLAQPAVRQIEEAIAENDPLTLVDAAGALWAVSGKTNGLAPLLAEFGRTANLGFVRRSLEILGEMGPAAKSAVPEILARLDPKNPNPIPFPPILQWAREALQKIDPGSEAKLPKEEDLMRGPQLRVLPGAPPPPPASMPLGYLAPHNISRAAKARTSGA